MHRLKHFIFLLLSLLILSCKKEQYIQEIQKPPDCDSSVFTFVKNYTFVNDLRPIFDLNCNFSLCHGVGGKGSYDFTVYEVVAARIRAGTLEYRLDLPYDDPQHMPEKMRLNSCDYFIIKTWIKQGYAKN